MKKRLLYLFSILCLVAIGSGCTHNGGPSGPLYGRWILESIEAKGCDAPPQHGQLYWAFQSNVIRIQRDNGHVNSVSDTFGYFNHEGDILRIDFPEPANPPFEETGLGLENTLRVLKLNGKEMILEYHPDPDTAPDATLTYRFKKW